MLSTLLALGGFLDPKQLVERGGLILVAAIIFAESGLLIGFFLPGDSLLFLTGFFVSKPPGDYPHIDVPLPLVLLILFAAATAGDQVGYWFGARVGPALFNRPDSRLFKQANVMKAQTFFEKYGAKTIVLCRFVPVVRTFAPIVAGVGKMRYRTFVVFNVIGAAIWAIGVTTLGYYLGKRQFIRDHIELSLIAIVALSTVPIIFELVRHRRAAKA
jgi:membrane-associated protein